MADHQQEIEAFGNNDDFWLFGYGSLIWKPPPHYDQRVPGYIQGYVRRFWQLTTSPKSEDHRGTPASPGRVVTLIDNAHWATLTDHHDAPEERVWGAAYHIPTQHVAAVRAYLDIREINGYSIQFTAFYPAASTTAIVTAISTSVPITDDEEEDAGGDADGRIRQTSTTSISYTSSSHAAIKCLVYIGLPSNPQFVGPQEGDVLARKILESKGPSGENKEYLYKLEEGLLGLSRESGDAHVSELAGRCRELEAEGK